MDISSRIEELEKFVNLLGEQILDLRKTQNENIKTMIEITKNVTTISKDLMKDAESSTKLFREIVEHLGFLNKVLEKAGIISLKEEENEKETVH